MEFHAPSGDYYPIIFPNEFSLFTKDFIPLNETLLEVRTSEQHLWHALTVCVSCHYFYFQLSNYLTTILSFLLCLSGTIDCVLEHNGLTKV